MPKFKAVRDRRAAGNRPPAQIWGQMYGLRVHDPALKQNLPYWILFDPVEKSRKHSADRRVHIFGSQAYLDFDVANKKLQGGEIVFSVLSTTPDEYTIVRIPASEIDELPPEPSSPWRDMFVQVSAWAIDEKIVIPKWPMPTHSISLPVTMDLVCAEYQKSNGLHHRCMT